MNYPQSVRVFRAAYRARWLAELAEALAAASRLTSRLSNFRASSAEAIVLRSQILALRTEVDALRRTRHFAITPADPKRMI